MKTMIRNCPAVMVLAAVALLSGGASLRAQNDSKMKEFVDARTMRMATALNLKPDQVEKLKHVNMQTAHKLEAMESSSKTDSMTALDKLETERRAALSQFLTPDQMKKYIKTQQQDLSMLQTEYMARALKLNAGQTKKVDKINLTRLQQLAAAKKAPTKMETSRKVREANEKWDTDLQKALTPSS